MAEQLKTLFFTPLFIEGLSSSLNDVYPEFSIELFKSEVFYKDWEKLELKQRMRHVTTCLYQFLPNDYNEAIDILMAIAPSFKGFDTMVFSDYAECYGLDFPEISYKSFETFTKCCSSEFAIRPFIIRYPQKTFDQMLLWAKDQNEHIRRLASEGCRPRLPWAMALDELKINPSPILPILEILKNDKSEMVRRSVANNLNDISKDHPELVLDIAEKWLGKNGVDVRIIKHACRTLLKKGNKKAMVLFGFEQPGDLEIIDFSISPEKVCIGEKVIIKFRIINKKQPQKLRLEYKIYYKTETSVTSGKVYQIHEKIYDIGSHLIKKTHSFVNQTTRKHYPGEHDVALVVNGYTMFKTNFILR